MLKSLVSLSFFAAAVASHAVVVYDTITPSTGNAYYNGTGNRLAGDNIFLASPGVGNNWQITNLSFIGYASAAGTYSIPITVSFYNSVLPNSTPGAAAFAGLAGSVTTTFSNLTATGPGAGWVFSLSSLAINLAAAPAQPTYGYGVSISYGTNAFAGPGAGTGSISSGYTNAGTSAAGSGYSTGMFIDTNNSGVLQNNEFYTLATGTYKNVALSVTAQAVPEPATMAALGLGALAMLRRRKRA